MIYSINSLKNSQEYAYVSAITPILKRLCHATQAFCDVCVNITTFRPVFAQPMRVRVAVP